MRKALLTFLITAATALPAKADKGDTGWTLTDDGTLTVTKEYVWDSNGKNGWKDYK